MSNELIGVCQFEIQFSSCADINIVKYGQREIIQSSNVKRNNCFLCLNFFKLFMPFISG